MRFVAGKQLQWVEPGAVKDLIADKYYNIRKESLAGVHKLVKFLKVGASKELFNSDPDIWKALRDKKMNVATTLTSWENAQFVVIDDELITIVSDESDIATSEFLNNLGQLDPETYSVMYNYSDKRFEAIAYNKTKVADNSVDGIIIDLNIPKRELRVWDAQIMFEQHGRIETILPVPKTSVKGSLDEDLFNKLGSIETMINASDASALMKYSMDDLKVNLSVSEAMKYIKKAGLAIKGKDVGVELSEMKYAVQHTHLKRFLDKLEETNLQYSQVKRMYAVAQSATLTTSTFLDIFEMYSQLPVYMEGKSKLKLAMLPDIMKYALSNKTHKKQIEQSSEAAIAHD